MATPKTVQFISTDDPAKYVDQFSGFEVTEYDRVWIRRFEEVADELGIFTSRRQKFMLWFQAKLMDASMLSTVGKLANEAMAGVFADWEAETAMKVLGATLEADLAARLWMRGETKSKGFQREPWKPWKSLRTWTNPPAPDQPGVPL